MSRLSQYAIGLRQLSIALTLGAIGVSVAGCDSVRLGPRTLSARALTDPPALTPSFWSDPPTLSQVNAGWENWPQWPSPSADITPNTDCNPTQGSKKSTKAHIAHGQKIAATSRQVPHIGKAVLFDQTKPTRPLRGPNDPINWKVTVASWNLQNFGTSKAYINGVVANPRTTLLDRIANISAQYDIVFFQELLEDWAGTFPTALSSRMVGFNCQIIAPALGWAGRKEYYGFCFKSSNATVQSISVTGSSSANACTLGGVCNFVEPANGATKCPVKIWMRPPGIAQVTIIPKDDQTPRLFAFVVNHLKPSYNASYLPSGGKTPTSPDWYPATRPSTFPAAPAGASRWPLPTASVYYELKALGSNIATLTGGASNTIILGDLNADCAYLPAYLKSGVLPATWSWLVSGQTNTGRVLSAAASSTSSTTTHCTYDQFLLNPGAQAYDRGETDVYKTGINTRLENKQVSDHYLIKMALGEVRNKRRLAIGALVPNIQNTAQQNIPQRAFKRPNLGTTVPITLMGQGISIIPAATTACLYVVAYQEGLIFSGSAHIPLVDVRSAGCNHVTINADGSLSPTDGRPLQVNITNSSTALKLVLDVNQDGYYDQDQNDLVNEPDSFDILVYDNNNTVFDGAISELGDNGRTRNLFSSGRAANVYALVPQSTLTAGANVHVYIVSDKLLRAQHPGFTTWSAARLAGNIRLDDQAITVPYKRRDDVLYRNQLVASDFTDTLQAANDGSLLWNAWPTVGDLAQSLVFASSPAPAPPGQPTEADFSNIAIAGDGCSTLVPGQTVSVSAPSFSAACNGSGGFADYYGTSFNIVIDVNNDGIFDAGDIVDASDTTALDAYFQSAIGLGPTSTNATAAITNYQNILETKLNAPGQSIQTGIYDAATAQMSSAAYCASSLSQTAYTSLVLPEAQDGFLVMSDSYYEPNSSSRRFANLTLTNTAYNAATAQSCVAVERDLVADSITYNGDFNISVGGDTHISGINQVAPGSSVHIVSAPLAPLPYPRHNPHRIVMDPGTEILSQGGTLVKAIFTFIAVVATLP